MTCIQRWHATRFWVTHQCLLTLDNNCSQKCALFSHDFQGLGRPQENRMGSCVASKNHTKMEHGFVWCLEAAKSFFKGTSRMKTSCDSKQPQVSHRCLSIEREDRLSVSGRQHILGHPELQGSRALGNGARWSFWVAAVALGLKLRPRPLLQAQSWSCHWVPLFWVT